MGRRIDHPQASSDLWPLVVMGLIIGTQVALLQVALNRLSWGAYQAVFAPAVATMGLSLLSWALYSQIDRERL